MGRARELQSQPEKVMPLNKERIAISKVTRAGTEFIVAQDCIVVGTTVVPNSEFSSAEI